MREGTVAEIGREDLPTYVTYRPTVPSDNLDGYVQSEVHVSCSTYSHFLLISSLLLSIDHVI